MIIIRQKLFSYGFWHQKENTTHVGEAGKDYYDLDGIISRGYNGKEQDNFHQEAVKIQRNGRKIKAGHVFYDRRSGKTLITGNLDSVDDENRKIAYMYLTDEKDPDKISKKLKEVVERGNKKVTPVEYKEELNKYKRGVRNKKIAAGIVGTAVIAGGTAYAYKHHKNKKKESDKKDKD